MPGNLPESRPWEPKSLAGRYVPPQESYEGLPEPWSQRDHELKADGAALTPETCLPGYFDDGLGRTEDFCLAVPGQPAEAVDVESGLQVDLPSVREALWTRA